MKFSSKSEEQIFELVGVDNLAALRTASGATDEVFKERYLPQLKRFAAWVQELPLDSENFNQILGAFRFGLTSAWLSLRLCDQVIFVQGLSHERRAFDPQYRFAAFCGCLSSTLLLVQHNLIITINEKPWDYLSPESSLLTAIGKGSYEVGWTRNVRRPSNALGVIVLGRFFEPGLWQGYSAGVCQDFGTCINPGCLQLPGESALSRVVRQGMEKAREIEARGRAAQYSVPTLAVAPLSLASVDDADVMSITPAVATQHVVSPSTSQTLSPDIEVGKVQGHKLSNELAAWAAHIRANAETQKKLKRLPDGSLNFDAKLLAGSGISPQTIYGWLKSGGYVVETRNEPNKHMILSSELANHLHVETEAADA